MGDGDRSLVARLLVSEPIRNTTHELKNRFSTVRCGHGIAQPRIGGMRLVRNNLTEGSSGPPSVIALTQYRLDARAQSKRLGGLAGPQFRAGPAAVNARQMPDQLGGMGLATVIERFVPGKGCPAHGIG